MTRGKIKWWLAEEPFVVRSKQTLNVATQRIIKSSSPHPARNISESIPHRARKPNLQSVSSVSVELGLYASVHPKKCYKPCMDCGHDIEVLGPHTAWRVEDHTTQPTLSLCR